MLRFSSILVPSRHASKSTFAPDENQRRSCSTATILLTGAAMVMLACLGSLPAMGACGTSWKGPATGNWSQGADWTAGLPTSSTDVCIDNGNAQHSAVTLDIGGAQAHNLTIDNDDSLSFNDSTSLTINGTTISNAGHINMNSAGNSTDLILAGSNTVTLTGGGTLTLDNNVNNRIYSLGNGTFINQETIQGAGQIGIGQTTLSNSGTINANVSNTLFVQPGSGGVTNTGTLEATSGGTLDLRGVYTDAGGTINASGTKSAVNLDNAVINGGTLSSSANGLIESINSVTLNGVTLSAGTNYVNPDNTNTLLQGTITNNGTIALNSGGNSTNLQISGPVTLTGTGTVNLGNNFNNRIYATNGVDTLTIKQLIQGAGQIGVGLTTLINQSTINANFSGSTLLIQPNSGGFTNSGILEATNGGVLELQSGTFTNTGATIEALNASGPSMVLLSNSTVTGGTLTTTGNGIIENTNNATLSGVTLTTGTSFLEPDNTSTLWQGTITNNGTISVNSGGNSTNLQIGGPVTLTGTGTVNLGNNFNNRIYATNGTDTLTIKQVIQGAGQIGVGLTTLVNQSTIDSNFSGSTLLIQPNGGGFTNTGGILQATNGGVLELNGNFVNTGGTIEALNATSASSVVLSNATITGGTLTSTGNGFIQNANNASLSGVTLTTGSNFIEGDNTSTVWQGTITNNGTIAVNSGGNNTNFQISGPVTLMGTGNVTLDNNANNRIYGLNGTDTLTVKELIQGAGQIGVGLTKIINQNVIDANVSSPLIISPNASGVTNTGGKIEATNGGTLDLRGLYTNTGGTIQALAGSLAELDGATVKGGTLTSVGTGALLEINGATLNGVTLSKGSNLTLSDNTTTNLTGTITDNGNINLNSAGNTTDIHLSGAVTLAGTGTLTLSNNINNRFYAPNGTDVLTNKATIQGAGQLGVGLTTIVNDGTINANQSAGLQVNTGSGGLNNQGTLQVGAGDTMHVLGGPFLNFSGTTLAGGSYVVAGTLEIDELGTTGGEIVTDAANITMNGASASFVDAGGHDVLNKLATIASTGSFTLAGGRSYTTAGNFTNNGLLSVGAGSAFVVNGSLTNFSGTTLSGGSYTVGGTLQFNNANIVTDAATILLTSSTAKIVDQSSHNALANLATISSGGSFGLSGNAAFTTAGNFTNNGTLAPGVGTKFVVNGNLSNFSGTTLTGGTYNVGGTLQFNNANIVNNAANIILTGASSKIINQTQVDALANFANNTAAGSFTLTTRSLTTAGSFSNAGTVNVAKGGVLTVGTNGSYTQTGGTTTVDGKLVVTSPGQVSFNAGSVFGNGGTFMGNVVSGAAFNIGDALLQAGKLGVTGNYTQSSTGSIGIDIGGLVAGSQFDQFNISGVANLGGTLNLDLIKNFTPTIGSKFDIINFASDTGSFATINGTHINANEHFQVVVNPNNITLDVVAGPGGTGDAYSAWNSNLAYGGTTATPEPSSLFLLGSGLIGGAMVYRKKFRSL